jgi:hypothetical protein
VTESRFDNPPDLSPSCAAMCAKRHLACGRSVSWSECGRYGGVGCAQYLKQIGGQWCDPIADNLNVACNDTPVPTKECILDGTLPEGDLTTFSCFCQ